MLERLYVKNYAIIDELTLEFGRQLNVMTGETGAGKSIIAGALSLILGDRADTSVLIDKTEKCIVEAVFRINKNSPAANLLMEEELDFEEEMIIRREISAQGKSRAFINDTPVVLSVLNKITGSLVDLHRQFDLYLMRNRGFEYEILDAVSGSQDDFKSYQSAFQTYQNLNRKYKEVQEQQASWRKEADYKQFLYDELLAADFQENEIEEAETTLAKLNHAEQIKQTFHLVHYTLEEAEPALNNELRKLEQELEAVSRIYVSAETLAQRLASARLELKDIADECYAQCNGLELDEEEKQRLQERLDLGNRLLKKHQVQSTAALIGIFNSLSEALTEQSHAAGVLEELAVQVAEAFKIVEQKALLLHDSRLQKAPDFAKEINALLHKIGMPNACIQISITESEAYHEWGKDELAFLWDANKSNHFQPIQKSASGGELSRIMLCLKTLSAEAIALPTLIFDEVDTGISGEAARQVAILLQQLSRQHQVLCITHQPQVAGRGNIHFFVFKEEKNNQVKTRVRVLSPTERIQSIAQMIGGEKPSEVALKNAREIMEAK